MNFDYFILNKKLDIIFEYLGIPIEKINPSGEFHIGPDDEFDSFFGPYPDYLTALRMLDNVKSSFTHYRLVIYIFRDNEFHIFEPEVFKNP